MVAIYSKTVKYVSSSLSLNDGTNAICLLISNSEELTGAVWDTAGRGEDAPTGPYLYSPLPLKRDVEFGQSLTQASALLVERHAASQAQELRPVAADFDTVRDIVPALIPSSGRPTIYHLEKTGEWDLQYANDYVRF